VNPAPALPYLRPWYRLAAGDGKVVLEYGQRIVCLEGGAVSELVPALLPLLDGTRTLDEIVALLGEPVRAAAEHVVGELSDRGLLGAGPPLGPDLARPAAAAAQLLASLRPGAEPLGDTVAAVTSCSVAIVGDGPAGLETARFLRLSGARVERRDRIESSVELTVCAPTPEELPLLPDWNRQALAVSQAWLQILPFDGRYAAVGPLYLPGDTGCYECFRLRRAANLGAAEELELLEAVPAAYPSAPAFDAVLGGLATTVTLHWLVLGDHYAPAACYAVEPLPTFRLTVHHLHRVPRCEACSGLADIASPLPWYKEVPVAAGR
jgi:bacteriocin biosynthesis cyclodehydratase domain-containing protein